MVKCACGSEAAYCAVRNIKVEPDGKSAHARLWVELNLDGPRVTDRLMYLDANGVVELIGELRRALVMMAAEHGLP